jgi:tRNA(adenine34) deaminase
MKLALSLAESAASYGEVPVGAIVVKDNRVISTGFNQKEKKQSVIQHAEVIAIEKASRSLNSWRLNDCTLYVTLEPCLMCAGAIYQSRISTTVFATADPKGGAFGSLYQIHNDDRLNHKVKVESGTFAQESSEILKKFFKIRRKPIAKK